MMFFNNGAQNTIVCTNNGAQNTIVCTTVCSEYDCVYDCVLRIRFESD
jgi:hypothetical protein